jgi:deoxyribonucleoside regulator
LNNNDIIFQVLKYYYDDDMTQLQIAQRLNISRIAVSRLLSKARKEGLLQFKIIYPKNFFNPRVENLEKEFLEKYNLKECIIAKTQKDRLETLKELSNQLSQLLDKIVENSTFIGVGWGTTLETISKYIEIKEKKGIRVTPLIGGYGKFSDDAHSNNIARIIAEKFNGTSYVINMPASFDTKEIKESILEDSTSKEVFKRTKMVDLAVLCMSDLSITSSLYDRGQLNDEDIDYLHKLGVIGDINYIFVDKDGNFVPNEISERTTNIFPISLMKSVKNVIGIAIGARKAIILHAVLKAGLINILLTDSEAASKIIELENTENYSLSL